MSASHPPAPVPPAPIVPWRPTLPGAVAVLGAASTTLAIAKALGVTVIASDLLWWLGSVATLFACAMVLVEGRRQRAREAAWKAHADGTKAHADCVQSESGVAVAEARGERDVAVAEARGAEVACREAVAARLAAESAVAALRAACDAKDEAQHNLSRSYDSLVGRNQALEAAANMSAALQQIERVAVRLEAVAPERTK